MFYSLTAPTSPVQHALPWERQRAFTLVQSHGLILSVRSASSHANFAAPLSAANLAFLWDHQIKGTACIPPAALLEQASAAAHACYSAASRGDNTVLVQAAASIAVALPSNGNGPTLECSVEFSTGLMAITSGRQALLTATRQQQHTLSHFDVLPDAPKHPWLPLIEEQAPVLLRYAAGVVPPPSALAQAFYLHPAALQATLLCISQDNAMLAAANCICLPSTPSQNCFLGANCTGNDIQISTALTCGPLGVQGTTFQPAEKLGLQPEKQNVHAHELVYNLQWQAATPTPAGPWTAFPKNIISGFAAGSTDPATAGARVIQLLSHHRDALPANTLSMLSSSSIAAGVVLTRQGNHIAGAFIAGILKNLPYELPMLSLQCIDQESTALNSRAAGSYTFSPDGVDASWMADMYGATARGNALLRPLLGYSQAAARDAFGGIITESDSSCASACMLTGGLGGIGTLTAMWAADRGSKALVLLGRSGQLSASSSASNLLSGAALVVMVKADASFSEDAFGAVEASSTLICACGTVIHAAGVQVEARLLKQTPSTMRAAAAPKLAAFERCALASLGAPVASSLLFSSVSSVTGNAGHANYAGANAALDAIAEQHSAMGSRVLAVQWGAWASVGEL